MSIFFQALPTQKPEEPHIGGIIVRLIQRSIGMEARANKVRRRSMRKARKQTRDRIRRNVRRLSPSTAAPKCVRPKAISATFRRTFRRKVAEMAFGRTHFGAAVLGDK